LPDERPAHSRSRSNIHNTRMRKPETLIEKAWRSVHKSKSNYAVQRYRGVILVASIPLLLVLAILVIVPRSSPLHYERTHTIKELRHEGATAPQGTRYAIVLDAGSTGSRIHVFKFEQGDEGLKLISDTFQQLKPGLSAFADDPEKAAKSLVPLMETAVKTVPKDLQATTPVSLKATAGLRLLPGDKADKILEAVRGFLKQYPYSVANDAVSILGGQDEGGFAWLTLNYLLGKLGGGPDDTVAAIDLGGGSVQEAFALSDADAAAAPAGYVNKLRGAGKVYNVYVHSYLGYGLMAARAKVIDTSKDESGHPCFAPGYNGTYKYAGADHKVTAAARSDFVSCSTVGVAALEMGKDCGAAKDQCSFSGAWRGKAAPKPRTYYVSSYFWDRAQDSGIIADADALHWETTPEEYAKKAQDACPKPHAEIPQAFPAVKAEHAPFFCLDLSFCHTLLTKGFGLHPSHKITLVKQIEYNGQHIEAAWPLGAAINDLSS